MQVSEIQKEPIEYLVNQQESLMHRRLLIDGKLAALKTMGMSTYAVHLEAKIPDGEGAGIAVAADDPARLLSWFGCSLSIGGIMQDRRSFSCTALSRVAEGLLVASLISLVLMFVAALAFGLENPPWFVLILPGAFLAFWMCSSAIYFVDFHISAARLRRKHLGIRFWHYTRERFLQSIGPLSLACLLAALQVGFFFTAFAGPSGNLVPIGGFYYCKGA